MRLLVLFATGLLACDRDVSFPCTHRSSDACGADCVHDDWNERCLDPCDASPCEEGFVCELVGTNDCADEGETICEPAVVAVEACVPIE